jgi:hypothetical protein
VLAENEASALMQLFVILEKKPAETIIPRTHNQNHCRVDDRHARAGGDAG